MKIEYIQRSVNTRRHHRTPGDAPNIGRVARIHGTGAPLEIEDFKSRREDWGWTSRVNLPKALLMWTLLFAGVVLLLVFGFLWLRLSPKIISEEELAMAGVERDESLVRVVARFPSPSEGDSLVLVKHALTIRDPALVGSYFRSGAANPVEIVDFLKGLEASDGTVTGYEWLSSLAVNRLSVEGVFVKLKAKDGQAYRLALLTPDETGKWKVDFEALARTVKPSWREILETSTVTAVVRVSVMKDSYYNGPFRDEKEWVCLGMVSPDIDTMLLGYCRVGSPQAAALDWMFSKGDVNLCRATLELRRVEGAEARQFEIGQVLAPDWIVDEVPFDEGFR